MSGIEISGAEKRQHARRRLFKGGQILFLDNAPVADCVVRDVSLGGARLQLRLPSPLPQSFRLKVKDLGTFECEVARIAGLELGVKFRDAAEQCAALFQDWPVSTASAAMPLARAG